MDESRRKLEDLLNPPPPSSSRTPASQPPPTQPDSLLSFDTPQRTEDATETIRGHSLSTDSQHRRHADDADSRFAPGDRLLHELNELRALTFPPIDAASDWTTRSLRHHHQQQQQYGDLAASLDDPRQHQLAQRNPELHRREAQSALYRQWRHDRARKIADLTNSRDQHALRQAQHSMQRFQQTLAAMQRGT